VLLMLTGATGTGELNWREFPRFSPDFRVLSPSYPPFESPEMLLEGVLAMLDAEGVSRAHVVGASMGAAIAHWFVREHPQRVGKLVLHSLGLPNQANVKAMMGTVRTFTLLPSFLLRYLMGRGAERLLSSLPADDAALMTAYFRDLYRNDIDKATMIGHFRLVAGIARRAGELGLDKPLESGHPVLIINAADDEEFSSESRQAICDTYPNARTHCFESGGHTLFDRREELYSLICDFIRE